MIYVLIRFKYDILLIMSSSLSIINLGWKYVKSLNQYEV